MTFINEVVSDEDIDRYGLPFKKGSGRYWTRDAERDYYLWGGKSGNPAFDEEITGKFHLFVRGLALYFDILPGIGSAKYSESPYLVCWKAIAQSEPHDLGGLDRNLVHGVLKEALEAYGEDGKQNKFAPVRIVNFLF